MAELRAAWHRAATSSRTSEGYAGDEQTRQFARRFYSDRSELKDGLGIPLESQRDEFTGEELYTLRSERYFLPPLDLDDDELAALQTCLYLLEGRFAYAEPLRLALQNLALGRSAGVLESAPTATAVRVEVRDPDYTPELQGRLGKLEAAISKQRTVRFQYWSIARDDERERTIDPYALLPENGTWYVIGLDLEDKVEKSFRVSRIRSEVRCYRDRRRERDFRVPRVLRRGGVPRPCRMAVRRHREERGADRPRPGHRVVGSARVRRPAQPRRGRRVRHRVRLPADARALGPPPGGTGSAARALAAA